MLDLLSDLALASLRTPEELGTQCGIWYQMGWDALDINAKIHYLYYCKAEGWQ